MSRLWVLPILGIVFASISVTACNSNQEEQAVPSPAQTSVQSPTQEPTSTTSPPATPTVTVPPEWPTYQDPEGRYTIRYPVDWFPGKTGGDFYSNDPSKIPGEQDLAPESIKVEVIYSTAIGSDVCGPILKTNPETGAVIGVLPGASPAVLGGIEGARIDRVEGDPALEDGLTRIVGIGTVARTDCVLIVAYFTQQNPDLALLESVIRSFKFLGNVAG